MFITTNDARLMLMTLNTSVSSMFSVIVTWLVRARRDFLNLIHDDYNG